MFSRRELLCMPAAAISGILAPVASAQSVLRLAWISPSTAGDGTTFLEEFRRGLREFGFVEGRNLVLDTHWGDYSATTTDRKVVEAISGNPQIIVALGPAALSVHRATRAIPVVFGFSGDAVDAGLIQSMARPGGNLTGISFMTLELVGKRMQLLKETLPSLRRVAVIAFPQHAGDQGERRASEEAAAKLGLTIEVFEAGGTSGPMPALALIEKSRNEAVVVFPVQSVIANRESISAWSVRNKIPTISGWGQFAEGGNLMSYGPSLRAANFRLAYFVDRVAKGVKPADLPAEHPITVELVVNARTAKALGVTIPQAVLLRADRVLE